MGVHNYRTNEWYKLLCNTYMYFSLFLLLPMYDCSERRIHTQPPESPYTRRKKVIFWGARTQACAIFAAIGAIAKKIFLRKSDECVDVCGGFPQKKKETRESFFFKSDVLYVNACGGFPKNIFTGVFCANLRMRQVCKKKNLQVFCAILRMRQAGFVYITHFPPWLQEQTGWRSGQSGG